MIRETKHAVVFGVILLASFMLRGECSAQGLDQQTSDELMDQSNIKGPLSFKGYVKELSKKLKGAIVTLYESPDGSQENMVEVMKTVTPGSGEFKFKLEINKFYVLSVEKTGYTTKKIDFDTDVSMARKQHSKVPEFEFEIDMVKDLDGLGFSGSVASVFYHIGRNEFDYQLDYSKEQMEEEERLRREQEEKRRLAELAAQKKFEMEEAAKLLRDKENASIQEKIQAAITVGDGNEKKTKEQLMKVFSTADTLREEKAEAMYAQLIEERRKDQAQGGGINYQNIFSTAKQLEDKVVAEAEQKREAKLQKIRDEKQEVQRKESEAIAIKQEAMKIEAKEKLAAAAKEEELRRAKEQKEQRDKIYYAIFNAQGDAEEAVKALINTYPRSDKYREEKAKAIYEEYEKGRLTGNMLSDMDFNKLFAAADKAEQEAISKEIEESRSNQKTKLKAFMEKVEQQKRQEQQEVIHNIETGMKGAAKDEASQKNVFREALPKNDTYKDAKADAMYEEYKRQRKVVKQIEQELKNTSKERSAQKAVFYNALAEDTPNREQVAEELYEEYAKQQLPGGNGKVPMNFGALFNAAETAKEVAEQEAKEKLRKEKLRAQEEIELKRQAVRQEKAQLAQKVAEKAEEVHKAKIAQAKNKKERELAKAFEEGGGDREKTVAAIMERLPSTDDEELDRERAEAVYDAYLSESKKIKKSGNLGTQVDYGVLFEAADEAELARLKRQFEEKQAEREKELAEYTETRTEKAEKILKEQQEEAEKEAREAEKTYEETLHKVEAKREERLARQKKEEEELAKQIAMEQAKRSAQEKEIAQSELDRMEAERQERLRKEREEAEQLAAAQEAKRREEERKAREEAERRMAEAEKARKEAELAAQKAEEERRKAEEERLAEEAKAKREAELAAKKAEEERKKAEQARVAAEAKAAEEARLAEQKRQEELARKEAEEAERQRKASYDKLMSEADDALAENRFEEAKRSVRKALELYPEDRAAEQKLAETESELARVEKKQAEREARKQEYDSLIEQGEQAQEAEDYELAKKKFEEAVELDPDQEIAKAKVIQVDQAISDLAKAEQEKREMERQYVILMQDGDKALRANDLETAQQKFEQASDLKPDSKDPDAKLQQVADAQEAIAAADQERKRREEEAKRKFEEQELAEQQRKEQERAERIAAIEKMDEQSADPEDLSAQEKSRIERYEKLKAAIEKENMSAEEQRRAFLSELAKIYPPGLTEETVEGKNFVLYRHVINENNVVTVYEKKVWDWGGVFHFKDTDIAITEALYKMEIGKYEK